jgi:hypothetical protein
MGNQSKGLEADIETKTMLLLFGERRNPWRADPRMLAL